MIETLQQRVNEDAGLVRRGRYLTTNFLLEVGQTAWLIQIFEGRIVSVMKGPFVMPSSSFALRAPEETLDVANSIPGCEVTIMKGLGHFPMSEDPQAFLTHLLPVLEKIGKG